MALNPFRKKLELYNNPTTVALQSTCRAMMVGLYGEM